MTLKTFTIKKLFNKYDITIKCDDKCVILLGVNGVGKSTSLKLLKSFIDSDFVNICAVPFDSIDIEYAESPDHNIIYYMDLFPSPIQLIENYKKYRASIVGDPVLEEPDDYMHMYDLKSPDEMADEFKHVLDRIIEEKKYGEFVYNLYKHRAQSLIVQSIIEERISYKDILSANIVRVSETVIMRCFEGCQYGEDNDIFGNWNDSVPSIFFNSVENFIIDNSWTLRSPFVDEIVEWVKTCPPSFVEKDALMKKVLEKEYKSTDESGNQLFIQTSDGAEIEVNPFAFPNLDIDKEIFTKLVQEKVFELNRLITRYYYDENFVIDINNRAKKYIEGYYELKNKDGRIYQDLPIIDKEDKELYEEVMGFFNNDVLRDYYEYLRPILVKNSFFDMDVELKVDPQVKHTYDSDLLVSHRFLVKRILLKGFINEVMPLLKKNENKSENIKRYEEVVAKYLGNKYITIKPCGIQIKESEIANQTQDKVFVLYSSNDIDLSVISSGEKKILIIFAIAIFTDGVLFIDEPELSLSLLWQETLVPDILKYGNISHLYVATHSPYISRDDELEQYLCYLPQKGN